ncbi:unnamed protein product [Auanema sp. JU1783]|nr:unnamed protein product [Auanema sp. JU1783]
MRHRERWKLILLFSVCFIVCLIILTSGSYPFYSVDGLRQYRRKDGCDVPHLNAWDPSISQFIKQWPPLKCRQTQYDLSDYTANGTLYLRNDQIKLLDLSIECNYRCYHKQTGTDDYLAYDDWIELKQPVQLQCEFVEVQCRRTVLPHNTIYSNNHNRIVVNEHKKMDEAQFKPNVIIFVLDSVSHSNFKRSLPKSLDVLKKTYKSHIFNGMTKVGDQSYPNAVAFLAGKTENEFGASDGFYDNHSLIWKTFDEAHYTTYYAEDYPGFNLFYYLAKGFQQKPVDHYFRPFWLNVYGSYVHRSSTNLCYGNTPMHQLQLDYLSQFIKGYHNKSPIFALNWLTELGHDYMNQVSIGDEDIAHFLQSHYEHLKDSFVFVLSDHGHRFDAIRETAVGRIEERLPFFSLHIPQILREKYPHLDSIVEKNVKLLTTFWDFHVTLRDIIDFSSHQSWHKLADNNLTALGEADKRWRTYSNRGRSLLHPLPDRTCVEAAVPEEYCVCNIEKPISAADDKIRMSADVIMKHINDMLKPYPQCSQLTIEYIVNAYQTLFDSSQQSHTFKYRLMLKVQPSEALFESLVSYDSNNQITVLGDVNRINRYGNQSICVDERQELRKFCFCSS